MKTKKNIKKNSQRTVIQGLLLISLSLIIFFSFISFNQHIYSKNFIGITGHLIAFFFSYLFGVSTYLILIFTSWCGYQLMTNKKIKDFSFIFFSFFIFICCISLLCNVFAENYPHLLSSLLDNKIYKEIITFYHPYIYSIKRLNFGGVPLYYIYMDLPHCNLYTLLGNIGITIVFSIITIVSLILLFDLNIILLLKKIYKSTIFFFINLLKILQISYNFLRTNIRSFKKEKKKKPLSEAILTNARIFQNKAPKLKTLKTPKAPPACSTTHTVSKLYRFPESHLLSDPPNLDNPLIEKQLKNQANILYETLKSFGIEVKIGNINYGPTITSFEIHPPIGVKVQKIKALEKDIALNLQAKSIRIIAPIPGKAAVGVEVPSIYPQKVTLKELQIQHKSLKSKTEIPLLLGKTVSGEVVITDLAKMPHLLIAGATGSGKSVCINTLVVSILMNKSPEDVKLLMIDPKKVELTQYSNLPHMIAPVITEAHGAYKALKWLVSEMQKRYEVLKQLGLRNILAFNKRTIKKDIENSLSIEIPKTMPLIITLIDEFADLMMVSSSDVETPIARIAQMARAVGIHLILATQRPSREIITGIIKANFPSRIAFKVSSRVNSQIILDENGAESLLGNGDMLFLPPGSSQLIRAQGAYISDSDINNIIKEISNNYSSNYLIPSFDNYNKLNLNTTEHKDKLYEEALAIILDTRNASTTFLQRKLKIGYARAASLIDELADNRIISSAEAGKTRKILIKKEDLYNN